MFNAYILNMKKDIAKLKHMEQMCSSWLSRYVFLEAVEGAALSAGEISKYYSEQDAIAEVGRPLSRGEIGCFLTHRKLYLEFLSSTYNCAIVLEDDVTIVSDIESLANSCLAWPGWDIIFLGHHGRSSTSSKTLVSFWGRKELGGVTLAKPCEQVMGTYGYIISRQGAAKMLKNTQIIKKPIDHLTGDYRLMTMYCLSEPAVIPDDVMSSRHHSMHERAELKAVKIHKAASVRRTFFAKVKGVIFRGREKVYRVARIFLPY